MQIHKVIFIGDAGVGKTAIIKAYLGEDVKHTPATIGIEFFPFTRSSKKIIIWDFTGMDWFKDVIIPFIKGAKIVVMVFDLSKTSTLLGLIDKWIPQLIEQDTARSPTIVLGNKADIKRIPDEFVQKILDNVREKVNLKLYLETSALSGKGIKVLFDQIFDLLDDNKRK
ncbi:MAG: GTP-binding protein [Candidatus Njordarchaeia archaeon]|nr:GTP-binding protein [Candidatus Korarchaeota archaeon]